MRYKVKYKNCKSRLDYLVYTKILDNYTKIIDTNYTPPPTTTATTTTRAN